MHYFEEYCEVHLEPNIAPFTWVFRSDDKICIKFGISLSKDPDCGQIAYELNDGQGYCDSGRIKAHTEGIVENGYLMFSAILPPISSGGGYRYSLGYVDMSGSEHTSVRSRFLLVCDTSPRSMTEIQSVFLGFVDNQPVYGPIPKVEMTSSPQDWDARLFYSIMIDRFARSPQSDRKDLGAVRYNPSDPYASHGGTIRGVTEQIEYLKSLGIKAIILSPVYVNAPDGYHGYHPIHLLMVDPRLGTLMCLRELVAKAHEADIAVILDVVNNHITDSINWEEYGGPAGGEFKYLQGDDTTVMPFPVEVRNTSLFHGPEYTDMVNQRMFGFLEDWRTETSYVRELLIGHLKYWIAETDIDGFRYDSARHIGLDFWKPCVEEISKYASYLGKKQFLQIAEHAGSSHEELIEYNDAKFSNIIDYPTYYAAVKYSLADGNWLGGLADYFCGFLAPSHSYDAGWRNNIMFLENQDTTRIFHEFLSRIPSQDDARVHLHFALACLILGPQIPSIYQGTEQEFSGALGLHQREDTGEWIGHDCYVREDMFENPACAWQFGSINRKSFKPYSTNHSTFILIQQLAKIRFQNKLIQSGTRTLLCSGKNGLWCVLIHSTSVDQPLFIAMNLGPRLVFEEALKIPNLYGEFSGVDLLMATSDGALELVEGGMRIRLAPFTFVLGRLLRDDKS